MSNFLSKATKTFAVLAFCALTMNCSNNKTKDEPGYIGPSEITVADGVMSPEVLLSLGRLSDPQLSPDGEKILFGVSYTSVEDNRSCRNIFVCDTDGGNRRQLTWEGKSVSNARWSSDGKSVFYLQGGELYKAAFDGAALGNPVKLSDTEGRIAEFKFSPDQAKLMFVSYVKSKVDRPSDTDPMLDKAQAYITEDLMYRHWDNWVTEIPHTFVAQAPGASNQLKLEDAADILGEEGRYFELPLMPYGDLGQLSWSPDGRYIAYSCKKLEGKSYAFSTNTDIYVYDTEGKGTSRLTFGGGYDNDPVWSPDGKSLAWTSMARDGYEADKTRLMLASLTAGENGVSIDGSPMELSAGFKYNVASPRWAPDSKSLYFNALAEGLQGIFKVGSEDGEVARVTPDSLWYDFDSPFGFGEDGKLLASYCSMDFPAELVAVNPADGSISQIGSENGHILSQVATHKTEKVFVKTVDGKDMLTWVLYPPQFDSTKTYPAIEILLGGPQGTLSQGWSYRWNYRLMAAQGYIVVLPNRRGTTAFGQEWTEQISGDYIGLNMQDYLAAAHYVKSKPYTGKLAACGASYGGYSVYYLAGIHNKTYDCFISHAGIFDEKYMYYETEEMWFPNWDNGGLREYAYSEGETGPRGDGVTFGGMMQAGSPWSSEAKAKRHYSNSPDLNVAKWDTPILCMHGGMDFRIPYDQGMAAFNAAQMMGVPSKLVVFPTECHWILEPQNALLWHREYFGWLDRWCKVNGGGE